MAAVLAVGLGLASCSAIRPVERGIAYRGSSERLAQVQPGDIAVAPIRNQTGDDTVPLEEFRSGFSRALVGRLYSPLDNAYVDASWVEASFRGTPSPDALLVVAITAWDPSRLYSTGSVSCSAEVLLFEGGSTTGTPLWGVNFKESVELGDGRGNPPSPSDALIGKAARMLAERALALLPERDTVAAHQR